MLRIFTKPDILFGKSKSSPFSNTIDCMSNRIIQPASALFQTPTCIRCQLIKYTTNLAHLPKMHNETLRNMLNKISYNCQLFSVYTPPFPQRKKMNLSYYKYPESFPFTVIESGREPETSDSKLCSTRCNIMLCK